jgi:hypothetical protein
LVKCWRWEATLGKACEGKTSGVCSGFKPRTWHSPVDAQSPGRQFWVGLNWDGYSPGISKPRKGKAMNFKVLGEGEARPRGGQSQKAKPWEVVGLRARQLLQLFAPVCYLIYRVTVRWNVHIKQL